MALLKNRFFIGTAVLAILLLYFFFDARTHFFPQCPFYLAFHFYCPGCGSQRAASALLHGDVPAALHDNVLMVVFAPLLLYSAALCFTNGEGQKMKIWYHPLFVKWVLAVVLVFWLLRNLPFYPFSLLAPVS